MPSALTTLATLAGVVINTGVSVATTIFTDYWPYVLVFGVLIGLVFWVKRVVGFGRK
jgi:hypothetical protein